MTAVWWLALAGLPVFQQPLPESPGEPAAFAIAAGRADMRRPCYALVCPDAEWLATTPYTTLAKPHVPGSVPELPARKPSPLVSRRHASLRAPVRPRERYDTEANRVKVATRFGFEAIRTPGTELRVELGTGYRLVPRADYGTAAQGPIARGRLQLSQRIGNRTLLNQQVQVETGRFDTFTRQVIGVDVSLQPNWTLQSRLETRHDSGASSTRSEGSVKLRYTF